MRAQQFGHLILLVLSLEIGLLTTSLFISKSSLGFLYLMVLKRRVKSPREGFFFCLSPQGTAAKRGEQKAEGIRPSRRAETQTKDSQRRRQLSHGTTLLAYWTLPELQVNGAAPGVI